MTWVAGRQGVSIIGSRGVQTGAVYGKGPIRASFGGIAARVEDWLAAERHQLPLFLTVFLGLGIGAYFGFGTPAQWGGAIAAALALVMTGVLANGLLRAALVGAGLMFALGTATAWVRSEAVAAPVLDRDWMTLSFEAHVLAVEKIPARDRTRLLLQPFARDLPAGMTIRISERREVPDGIGPGAHIRLRASLSPPPGPSVPGGYHFARRAWFDGIGAIGYTLGPIEIIEPAPIPDGISARFQALREGLTQQLQSGVGGAEGGLAAALVTGDRGGIPIEVTEAMRDSGLAHLISISGLHIAVVVGAVLFVMRRLLALSPWLALRADVKIIAALFAAAAGIGYTLLAGASVPTVRSCIAVLIVLIGLAAGREAISLRLVATGAGLILLWAPEQLLNPSFQLSFAAVTGIVALYQSGPGRRFSAVEREIRLPGRMLRGIVALILTGLVAELALAPIALYHFNHMGLYGIAANLVAIPLTSFLVLPLLLLAVLFGSIGWAGPIYALLKLVLGFLIVVAETTSNLPGAVASAAAFPTGALAIIVLGGLWLCLWQTHRRWLGLGGVAVGALGAVLAPQPDLLIGPQGTHLAYVADGELQLLRPRTGDYIRDMWTGAAGVEASGRLDDSRAARCSPDACTLRIVAGGRIWDVLATRSDYLIDREVFEPACARADIVVSERWLPGWCRPKWLLLDRETLARSGAVSIDFNSGRARTVADDDGAHSWARVHHRKWD